MIFFLGFLVNDSVVWMENIHGSEIINLFVRIFAKFSQDTEG